MDTLHIQNLILEHTGGSGDAWCPGAGGYIKGDEDAKYDTLGNRLCLRVDKRCGGRACPVNDRDGDGDGVDEGVPNLSGVSTKVEGHQLNPKPGGLH